MPYPVAVHHSNQPITAYDVDQEAQVVVLDSLLDMPLRMYCPHCQGVVVTSVKRRPGG